MGRLATVPYRCARTVLVEANAGRGAHVGTVLLRDGSIRTMRTDRASLWFAQTLARSPHWACDARRLSILAGRLVGHVVASCPLDARRRHELLPVGQTFQRRTAMH